jgi:hypothetical protein
MEIHFLKRANVFLLLAVFWFSNHAFAQSQSSVGGFLGKVVPSGPQGVTEIFGVGGFRYSTSSSTSSQTDMGAIFGAAGPVRWTDFFINTRYNMPSQGFTKHAGIGLDLFRYRTGLEQTDPSDSVIRDANGDPVLKLVNKTSAGLFILGGITVQLVDPVQIRADIKFNVIPDLILTMTAGLEWRFGGVKEDAKGAPPKAVK